MELSQTTLIMVHKLTTPVTLDIVFMETDIAPVSRMMEAGLGQSQLVLTKVSVCFVNRTCKVYTRYTECVECV